MRISDWSSDVCSSDLRVMTHIEPKTPREKRWENEGGAINPAEEGLCDAPTLRAAAMQAIDVTRFVPEKGRNRIGSMVKDRPDWEIGRASCRERVCQSV